MSLQLAPGWTVNNHKATYVILANSARTVFYQISTGPSSGDAVQTLTQDIQTTRTAAAEGQIDFQFIQLQGSPESDPPPNTKTYDSGASVAFTAKAAPNSVLSGDVVGEFGELVDSTDGKSVLVIAYAGSTDDLNGAAAALKSMNDSLLSS